MPLTADRIQAIYDELEKYVIALDPDPRGRGTAYLQDLIATCRNHLNNIDRILREVHREDHRVATALRLAEVAFQMESDHLLASDESIRRLPNIEDRRASIAMRLRIQRQAIEALKGEAQDLKFVDKIVRHQHKQLTATMGEIKLQRSIIEAEIRTGAMYGDERTMAAAGGVLGIDEAELDALFAESRAEQKAAEGKTRRDEETPEEKPAPAEGDPDEEAIRDFIAEDDDFGEVFKDL